MLLWNRPNGKTEPPITTVERYLEPDWPEGIHMPLDLDPRQFDHARDWPRAFERSTFEPLRHVVIENVRSVDRDELVAFFGSMGWIGGRPVDEVTRVLDEVRARLTSDEYRLPFETHVYWTRSASTRGGT